MFSTGASVSHTLLFLSSRHSTGSPFRYSVTDSPFGMSPGRGCPQTCSLMVTQIPVIPEKPLAALRTCTAHSGAKKGHDWAVDQLADLRRTHRAKTSIVYYHVVKRAKKKKVPELRLRALEPKLISVCGKNASVGKLRILHFGKLCGKLNINFIHLRTLTRTNKSQTHQCAVPRTTALRVAP